MTDTVAPNQVNQDITIERIVVACEPRLAGFIHSIEFNPKCKHDWEAHRFHSCEVKLVFGRLDAATLLRAAEAARQIRDEVTTAVTIRKIGQRI